MLLAVAIAGACGAVARYVIDYAISSRLRGPTATSTQTAKSTRWWAVELPESPITQPGTGAPYGHGLSVRGARLAANPTWRLSNAWEMDGKLGVHYLHRRITSSSGSTERQRDFGPFAGIGVIRHVTPNISVRFGFDGAEDYQALSVGLRIPL
jgi:hypothetical protein